MVVFGNVTIDGTVVYNGTATDEIMNYLCAGILIFFLVTGIYVNSHLIYYYKCHRPSWIDRYLWCISIARLVCIMSNCILAIYQLLNLPASELASKSTIQSLFTLKRWEIALNILSYLSTFALLALDAVIVSIQYGNIHHPLWTIRQGPFKVTKSVLIAVGILFMVFWTGSIIYAQIHRSEESIFPFSGAFVINTAISLATFFALSLLITSIYLTNWIRYWHQVGAVVVGEIVRREFRLVSVLTLSDFFGSVSLAVFLVNIVLTKDPGTFLYIWCFSGTIVPVLVHSLVSGYMLLSERNL
jgi:hypothetical protein